MHRHERLNQTMQGGEGKNKKIKKRPHRFSPDGVTTLQLSDAFRCNLCNVDLCSTRGILHKRNGRFTCKKETRLD